MSTWDGIWTFDLLRDLCGGVTRSGGKVKVCLVGQTRRNYTAPEVTIERIDRTYRIEGINNEFSGDFAVDELNRLGAVPVNDDGTMWKVRRPESRPGLCESCEGTGKMDCPECGGDGDVECCECGHEKDCDHCWGSGEVECECVAALRAVKTS